MFGDTSLHLVLFFTDAHHEQVRAWAERRGLPGRLQSAARGWQCLQVCGLRLGVRRQLAVVTDTGPVPAEELLVELGALSGSADLVTEDERDTRLCRGGVVTTPGPADEPAWDDADEAPRASVVARLGDATPEVRGLASGLDVDLVMVREGGWTFVTAADDDPEALPESPALAIGRHTSAIGLYVFDDRVMLELAHDEQVVVGWEWNGSSRFVGPQTMVDEASGENGEALRLALGLQLPPRDLIADARITPADPDLFDRLLVTTDASPADLVPDLCRALGLPAWVADHLLGRRPMSGHLAAEHIEPAPLWRTVLGAGFSGAGSTRGGRLGWAIALAAVAIFLWMIGIFAPAPIETPDEYISPRDGVIACAVAAALTGVQTLLLKGRRRVDETTLGWSGAAVVALMLQVVWFGVLSPVFVVLDAVEGYTVVANDWVEQGLLAPLAGLGAAWIAWRLLTAQLRTP